MTAAVLGLNTNTQVRRISTHIRSLEGRTPVGVCSRFQQVLLEDAYHAETD